jgi:SAM-dependent methyltransferase
MHSDGQSAIDPTSASYAGQAVYTPRMLRAYNMIVVGFSNSVVWRCPASRIVAHYDKHVAATHLDIGPGSGYYLEHCRFPLSPARLTLLDPNPSVLRHAADRVAHHRPVTHLADALEPIDLAEASFGSVGISYVLHCMPGPIARKAVAVIDHALPLLEPGGTFFGTTIVADPSRHNALGRRLMRLYNHKGIFSNTDDTLAELEAALAGRFASYSVEVVGGVALFAALAPGPNADPEPETSG